MDRPGKVAAGAGEMRRPAPEGEDKRAKGRHAGAEESGLGADEGTSAAEKVAALALLLRIEALARQAQDLGELAHVMANETRKLNRARQVFVIEIKNGGAVRINAASGVGVVDQRVTLADNIRTLIKQLERETGLGEPVDFSLPAYTESQSDLATSYPFREILWQPFLDRRACVFAGLLIAREQVWTKDDTEIAARLAGTYAHAWRELATAKSFRPPRGRVLPWAALLLVLAFLIVVPVPMTALAPAEIVARDTKAVTASLDGTIERIEIEPGATVKAGDVVVRLTDTMLRNRLEIARQELIVAEAKAKQAMLLAFDDARGRHELGIAQAEQRLKRAEVDYARELLERSVIRAPREGIAIYTDRKSIEGKPVRTGERILMIADPGLVEIQIDLAAPDAMALEPDSAVRLFLDVDPLVPWAGKVRHSDYRAQPSSSDVLAFRTIAHLAPDDRPLPRIGLRGTAQVSGRNVALFVFLFRRPISTIRQWLGM